MLSLAASVSSRGPNTISLRQPSQSPADVHTPQNTLPWSPIYLFQSCQHAFQDGRPYWPHHHPSLSSRSGLVPVWNVCPHCQRRPKHPDHRFCSVACGQSAARSAPELKYLPPNHELFIKSTCCICLMFFSRRWGIDPPSSRSTIHEALAVSTPSQGTDGLYDHLDGSIPKRF